MDEQQICREIISLFFSRNNPDISHARIEVCRKYKLKTVPKNSLLFSYALPDERERLRLVLQVKPTRTLSGVAPVAVMTSPSPCPHGKCLPCPGGPDHLFQSPQSYTGEEPAAIRGREHRYDPYEQVIARLSQFETLGHHVGKAELIVMGGTITARPKEYQEWFVTRCIQAMNEYDRPEISPPGSRSAGEEDFLPGQGNREPVFLDNERARVRCVAITFETRPDWCRKEHIGSMLDLGVTKVELGVQHVDDEILTLNRRGCTVQDTADANRLLRDAGIKVGFHIMPNLPGSSIEMDRELFRTLFDDPRFRPDFLKIYPTLVTPGSEIEELWKCGSYSPYSEEELIDLIAYGKSLLPVYVRLQRIQRDIPAKLIVAGSKHSNFRQLASDRLIANGGRCRCIRCREIGRFPSGETPELITDTYECAGGTEHFISSVAGDSLVGFARLRFPGMVFREELCESALLRELHVYGSIVPIGHDPSGGEQQHRSTGSTLLSEAEEIARGSGYHRISVMSGIGVRPYYRNHGYERAGPYMQKEL
ncbi:MAG: tRNA uridine(34) 5-carboxymethylaminomethyl modification radical SAM/GNAT enzyme Elp3 [Methanoregulaceae archaeon]|jgi:elongator complex protein 3|nr:tRNA uridine(34) 5-carboxymethylaminomethyl modification radical SAM/GNAT enzyme Elp3 [Methanoregulaceae archaeon]